MTIDASGDVGADGLCSETRMTWNTPISMMHALAQNRQVHACFTLKMFQFATQRAQNADGLDANSLARIFEGFVGAELNIKELMVSIATSRAMLYRNFGN